MVSKIPEAAGKVVNLSISGLLHFSLPETVHGAALFTVGKHIYVQINISRRKFAAGYARFLSAAFLLLFTCYWAIYPIKTLLILVHLYSTRSHPQMKEDPYFLNFPWPFSKRHNIVQVLSSYPLFMLERYKD